MDEKKIQEETKKIIGKGRRALRLGVNIFVYTFVGIFMLLMIFFGVSQTSFFKNWLRDTVVEIVNEGIQGKLSIEEIDGTIFTSLLIKNATLTSLQKDTVVSAGNIELRTSPLKILFKNIYIRKFELKDAKIKLVEESDGDLNLLKIFPPSDEPEDTTTSEFPFTIEVLDFALTNVDFSMQRYDKVGSTEYYKSMTTEDLRINDLNVSFNAFADLNKYSYRLTINNISFSPNFNFFQLQHLSGSILLTPQLAGVNKLHLITRDSDVELSAAILGVDFLEDFSEEKLSIAPIRFSLNASKLNVDDIATYVQPLEMLEGSISADMEASGTLSELLLKKLNIIYNNTSLKAKANLKNLMDADKMYFDLSITDSYLDPSDPNKLLRNIELPEYKEFGIIKIDTINYRGGPLDFNTVFALRTDKGNLNGNASIDLRKSEMVYDATIFSKNLDLSSFTSVSTDMNSEIKIKGVGFDPKKMKLDFSLDAVSSRFGEKYFDEIILNSNAENGVITTTLSLSSDSTSTELLAHLDFNNLDDPGYDIKGKIRGINLSKLLNNESLDSELNLSLEASGQGFNPDSMDLFLVTDIKNSRFLDFDIDSTRLIMDIRRNDGGKKIINIISDIADFTISGDFMITSLGTALGQESDIISSAIKNKIDPMFKKDSSESIISNTFISSDQSSVQDFSLEYLLDFKEAMNLTLGKDQLQLDGQIQGFMESSLDSLIISMNSKIDYLKYWNDEDVYFLLNTNLICNLSNHMIDGYGGNINTNIEFNSDRIYASGNIYDIKSKITLLNNDLIFSASGKYEENIVSEIDANMLFTDSEIQLNITKLDFNYNRFNISNRDDLLLTYSAEDIYFKNVLLYAADGTLNVNGTFGPTGDHNLSVSIESLNGKKLTEDILGTLGQKSFDADIDVKGLVTGNFSDPKFSITASAKDIMYGESNFGSLHSVFHYTDNTLTTDIRFLDSTDNYDFPAMLIKGFVPLTLTSSKDSLNISSTKEINLTIQSDEFDLSTLKNILPYVQFLGILQHQRCKI